MPENQDHPQQQNIQIHVSPDLDYSYRDVTNIYVGSGDVIFEFGNHHRSMPGNVTISSRVVMTFANAYDFQQRLQLSLIEAQEKVKSQIK